MPGASIEWYLFISMLKEEWRLHKSFIGGFGSSLFPVMILLFSIICSLVSPLLIRNIELKTILLLLHLSMFLYGVFVGGFGQIGEEAMRRRFGQLSMILQMPQIYPISFRKIIAIFYVKDLLYYVLYSIVPLIAGISVGATVYKIGLQYVMILGSTMFLAFMMGMSGSFLLSAICVRWRLGNLISAFLAVSVVISIWPLNMIEISHILFPLGFWISFNFIYVIYSMAAVIIFSVSAILLMKERFEPMNGIVQVSLLEKELLFDFFGDLKTLIAKEWLELTRSRALVPILLGFIGPLVAIFGMTWMLQNGFGLPLHFNTVFYGGFVGFMGMMTYSWLTNLEGNEFLNNHPIQIHLVIKAKLCLYYLLTTIISTLYVVAIGLINSEAHMIPLALLFCGANTMYISGLTSFLTGLWTNTMLFDAKVLIKFATASIPPLLLGILASFSIDVDPMKSHLMFIITISVMLIGSIVLLRGLDHRWRGAIFSNLRNG